MIPPPLRGVLARGRFCELASAADGPPHLVPLVYAPWGSELWVTTARSSVKARRWRRDPTVAGLVRHGELAVAFTGTVAAHDVLDPGTWVASALRAPTLTLAAAAFTARNARFFAGYAVDARHVPLAWTPPGRVFAGVAMRRAALLDLAEGEVLGVWDLAGDRPEGDEAWDEGVALGDAELPSRPSFRRSSGAWTPLGAVPADVAGPVGHVDEGTVAVAGGGGLWALPARWVPEEGGRLATVPSPFLALAVRPDDPARAPATLLVHHASAWRARAMRGVMVRGTGSIHRPAALRSGSRSASLAVLEAGADPDRSVLLRVDPRAVVWWRGWASGTVAAP